MPSHNADLQKKKRIVIITLLTVLFIWGLVRTSWSRATFFAMINGFVGGFLVLTVIAFHARYGAAPRDNNAEQAQSDAAERRRIHSTYRRVKESFSRENRRDSTIFLLGQIAKVMMKSFDRISRTSIDTIIYIYGRIAYVFSSLILPLLNDLLKIIFN